MLLLKSPIAIKSLMVGFLTLLFWVNFVIHDPYYLRIGRITAYFPPTKNNYIRCRTLINVLERLNSHKLWSDSPEPYINPRDRSSLIKLLSKYGICYSQIRRPQSNKTTYNSIISLTMQKSNITRFKSREKPKISSSISTSSYILETLTPENLSLLYSTHFKHDSSTLELTGIPKLNLKSMGTLSSPTLDETQSNHASTTVAQRGPYRILMDLFTAVASPTIVGVPPNINGKGAVTIATQCSPAYLSHLRHMARRWAGPISVAVYSASSSQVNHVINTIRDLRTCDRVVRRHVTFHLFYYAPPTGLKDFPKFYELLAGVLDSHNSSLDCSVKLKALQAATDQAGQNQTHTKNRLEDSPSGHFYPVNTGRNVARLGARTGYVFTLDVEFVPSDDLMNAFLRFVNPNPADKLLSSHQAGPSSRPKVFVIPAFEVKTGIDRPFNKVELLRLISRGEAVPFHKKRCHPCHIIPNYNKFIRPPPAGSNETEGLKVLAITKWIPPYWEPIFISSNQDPLYDERFLGYGRNKIQMCYELCRAGYLFYVLDGAFVTHQGISVLTKSERKAKASIMRKNNVLFEKFKRELNDRYNWGQNDPACEFKMPRPGRRKQALVSSGKAKSQSELIEKLILKDQRKLDDHLLPKSLTDVDSLNANLSEGASVKKPLSTGILLLHK